MVDKKNVLRLRRSRSVGFALIGVMGFLIAGFVFQPVVSSIPNIAPQEQFQLPVDEIFDNSNAVQEEPNQTPEQIDEIIEQTNPIEDIIQINEEVDNSTKITSDDPPLEQIVDETKDTIADVVLPDIGSETISLIAEITKTDSNGTSTLITNTFDVPLQALFVESGTNIDFSTGSLNIRLRAISSVPEFTVSGSASLDILIDNKTIFTMPVGVAFSGISGEDGVVADFVSQTGQKSGVFTFLFQNNIDKFPTSGITPIQIKLNNLELRLDDRQNYGSTQIEIFKFQIETDPNLVLVADEEGMLQRIYPKDFKFTYTNTGDKFVEQGECRSYWARHAGTITLYDSLDNIITTKAMPHGGCNTVYAINGITLDRNSTYRLVHVSQNNDKPDTNFDITFTTPKSQKNISAGCYWSNTVGVGCTYPSPDSSTLLRAPPL